MPSTAPAAVNPDTTSPQERLATPKLASRGGAREAHVAPVGAARGPAHIAQTAVGGTRTAESSLAPASELPLLPLSALGRANSPPSGSTQRGSNAGQSDAPLGQMSV